MKRKTYRFRRAVAILLLTASVAAIAVPQAIAGGHNDSGLVPSKLGSQDPKETAQQAQMLPGLVAARLGSPDPLGTAQELLDGSSIAASDLGSPDVRDAIQSTRPATVPSTDGIGWGRVGIETAVAVCGLLLLVALGIGTRQLRHGGHRLRRA